MSENLRKRIRRPNNTHYVYGLLRETGEPFYVGMGKGDRWNDHEKIVYQNDKANRENPHRTGIIRKMLADGWVSIPKIKFIEGLSRKEALDCERALVAAIGRWPNGPLVNLTPGGDAPPSRLGSKMPPESIARASAARRGRKHSAEARAKISATRRARVASGAIRFPPRSVEVRAKIAAGGLGRKPSAETRAKLSAAASRRPPMPQAIRDKISATKRGIKYVSPN